MLKLKLATLYTALALGANALAFSIAHAAGPADLEALREGDMKKLALYPEARTASEEVFFDAEGNELSFEDWRGKVVLVNFWATWCAPCRKEMPSLDALESELGGENFEVVAVATGRNPMPAIQRFFEETGVENLDIRLDPKSALARDMAVLGLPVTLILDRDGQEIGRLTGEADWNSPEAQALLKAVIAQ